MPDNVLVEPDKVGSESMETGGQDDKWVGVDNHALRILIRQVVGNVVPVVEPRPGRQDMAHAGQGRF